MGRSDDADNHHASVLVMNWQSSLVLMFLGFVALAVVVCVRDANRKRKTRRLLDQLNSPFFRQVTDAYYRVGNLSGVGK